MILSAAFGSLVKTYFWMAGMAARVMSSTMGCAGRVEAEEGGAVVVDARGRRLGRSVRRVVGMVLAIDGGRGRTRR